jgi:hypothetical protein
MKYILFTLLVFSFVISPVYYTQAFNFSDAQKQLGAMVSQLQILQTIMLSGIFTDASTQTLLDDNETGLSHTCTSFNGNIAPCAIASASSVWSADYNAAKANDSNNLTRWNSAMGDAVGAWFALDFGTSTTYNKIVISEAIPRITGYSLQSWDGLSWQNIISDTAIGYQKTHTFTPITSEKVRLVVTGMIGGSVWVTPTLYEFEVWHEVPKFILGDSIQTTDDLKVRSAPSTTAFLLGIQSADSQGRVIDGPMYTDGYIWWKIDYDVMPDGWSAQNWLEKIQVIPLIPPLPPNTAIINQLLTLVRQAIEMEAVNDQNLSSVLQNMEILLLQLQNGPGLPTNSLDASVLAN